MKILKFEDIIAWQKSQQLAVDIYAKFSKSKDFSFKDQTCRPSVSISNNIAEGFDRNSNADFARLLYIPLASCSEVKSMLYLAERLNFLNKLEAEKLRNECSEISKIITSFIKSIKNNWKLSTDN